MSNRSLLMEWRQRWNRRLCQFLRHQARAAVNVQDLTLETYLRLRVEQMTNTPPPRYPDVPGYVDQLALAAARVIYTEFNKPAFPDRPVMVSILQTIIRHAIFAAKASAAERVLDLFPNEDLAWKFLTKDSLSDDPNDLQRPLYYLMTGTQADLELLMEGARDFLAGSEQDGAATKPVS